tara:strand:- start:355 stop:525 length:171 start_codon:yes stop_codon:yes gene_type:complete
MSNTGKITSGETQGFRERVRRMEGDLRKRGMSSDRARSEAIKAANRADRRKYKPRD